MHRVAGFDDLHDFLGIAVNQGNLTGVTQGNAEDVFQVQVVHLFLRTVFRSNDHLPGVLHVSQAELGRLWRLVHDVLGHQFHGFFVEVTRGQPVRHTGRGAVADKGLQVVDATLLGNIRGQRLTGGAFAQYTVTAGAALEVDFLGLFELGVGQVRGAGGADDSCGTGINGTGGAFVCHGCVIAILGGGLRSHHAHGRNGHREGQWLDHHIGYSHQVLSLGFKSTS